MNPAILRRGIYAALSLAFILRIDVWWWFDDSRLLGLPVGLTYHLLFCLAVAALMGLLVRFAWPVDLGDGERRVRS